MAVADTEASFMSINNSNRKEILCDYSQDDFANTGNVNNFCNKK